jgi:hypothetical protein
MLALDAKGTETRIAPRVAAHNHQGAVQGNIWTIIESHNACVYGGSSSIKATG